MMSGRHTSNDRSEKRWSTRGGVTPKRFLCNGGPPIPKRKSEPRQESKKCLSRSKIVIDYCGVRCVGHMNRAISEPMRRQPKARWTGTKLRSTVGVSFQRRTRLEEDPPPVSPRNKSWTIAQYSREKRPFSAIDSEISHLSFRRGCNFERGFDG